MTELPPDTAAQEPFDSTGQAVRPTEASDFQTGKVAAISAAHLSHDVYSSFLAPLSPLLMDKLGLSLSAVALLDIARKLPQLSNPLIGLLADRLTLKYFVILAPAVTALCMSLLGVAPSFPVVFSLLFISGFSAAAFHVPGPVLIKHYSGWNSGRGMSFYMFGGELARTLGPLLITAAVSWWGLEGSWRVLPLGLVVSVMLYFRLRGLQPVRRTEPRRTFSGSHPHLKEMRRMFLGLAGFLACRGALKVALTLFLPTYLTSQGQTLWVAGMALALLQAAGAVGTLSAGWVADRFGHRRTLLTITVLTPVSAAALNLFTGFLTVPFLLLTGVLIFASSPILLAVVQDTGTSRPAFVNGLYMTLSTIIAGAAAYLVGSMGDSVGLLTTYRVSIGLSVLAIPFVLLLAGCSRR